MEPHVISNVVAALLIAALGGGFLALWRDNLWRAAGRELRRRRPIALAVVGIYAAVALLDSISWVGGAGEAGEGDQLLLTSQDAVALARRLEHPLSLALALAMAAQTHLLRREPGLVEERADEAIALAEEHGFPHYLAVASARRGWARAVTQGGDKALAEIQQALAEVARIRLGVSTPIDAAVLAEAFWKVGRHADALETLALVATRTQETGAHHFDAEHHRIRAEILLDQDAGMREGAEGLLRRALEIARGQEAKSFELRVATSLARLLRHQERRNDARALLAPVYEWFTEGFDTPDLKDAKALLDEL